MPSPITNVNRGSSFCFSNAGPVKGPMFLIIEHLEADRIFRFEFFKYQKAGQIYPVISKQKLLFLSKMNGMNFDPPERQ